VKDLQRQGFFFEQEIKRKKLLCVRMQKEVKEIAKMSAIQKKLEKKAAKEVYRL
jgi:hypothetical protein